MGIEERVGTERGLYAAGRRLYSTRSNEAARQVRPITGGNTYMQRVLKTWLFASAAIVATHAVADGEVNIICSVPIPWCEAAAAAFQKESGIKTSFVSKRAGEAMAQVAAEKANPKLDVWYTGTGDPHLQAAELGPTAEYKTPMLPQLPDWAGKQAEPSKSRTVGV